MTNAMKIAYRCPRCGGTGRVRGGRICDRCEGTGHEATPPKDTGPFGRAVFSDCFHYRWRLDRDLGKGPTVLVIGCNPSTADAVEPDQTVSKEIGFGKRLGWGKLIKGNLFGIRTTEISGLATHAAPIGAENDRHLRAMMKEADLHIAAWGGRAKLPPALRSRPDHVAALAAKLGIQLFSFGTNLDGSPCHTERIGYDRILRPWNPSQEPPVG